MSPRWHQLPQEPPLARFIPETKTNVAALCGQTRVFFEMPGRGVRLAITSVETNRTFLVKCRLVRAKCSLSRNYKTASTEIVICVATFFFVLGNVQDALTKDKSEPTMTHNG